MKPTTGRTLEALRRHGYEAGVVERWIPQARRRVDLFGLGDIVAYDSWGVLLVQTTTVDNGARHRAAVLADDTLRGRAARWVSRPDRAYEVWTWAKRGGVGKRKLWSYDRWSFVDALGGLQWVKLGTTTAGDS